MPTKDRIILGVDPGTILMGYGLLHIDNAILSLGANDNASGVAAMLEIARNLKDIETDKEIRFLATRFFNFLFKFKFLFILL